MGAVTKQAVYRAALLVSAVAAVTTCSDSPFEPVAVSAQFDLRGFVAAVQSTPIPADELFVELRRVSDSSVAFADTLNPGAVSSGDSLVVNATVDLMSNPEQFFLYAELRGNGVVWFSASGTVTASADSVNSPPPIVPDYVGPGAAATSVVITPIDTMVAGGDSVLVTGTVFEGQTAVSGAPVSFASGDTALVRQPTQVGMNQAWVSTPSNMSGQVTITATAPVTGGSISDSTTIGFYAPAAQLVKVSGDAQQLLPNAVAPQPLVVQVQDASGAPFPMGFPVVFAMASGPTGTSLSADTVISDAQGTAQVTLTAGSTTGTIQVTATAQGLTGSPITFTADVTGPSGPANVAVNSGNNQSVTVGTVLPVNPSVIVTDAGGNALQGVSVTFAVTAGLGSITGATQTTDAGGIATVGGWTLGTVAGANTMTATVTGLTPATFTATGLPDAPVTLVKVSGDAQTVDGGMPLPAPLVVEVQDQFANPVPSVTVAWATSFGSVTPTSSVTDAQGRTQTSWTLGTGSVNQTATATVAGITPVVFSATATFPTPTILLSLAGTNRVPAGGTGTIDVQLSSPAGAGGVSVTVSSDNTGILTVQGGASATVSIAQGASTGQVSVDGVSQGTVTVRGNATGFTEGTVDVTVSVQVLSMPATLNVPFGGTASLPVQISTPAPAGGVDVTLISTNPTAVSVLTPTVNIAAGLQTANATVSGEFPGTATVTGTTANFGSAQTTVSTTANLNITRASVTLNASFSSDITIQLESGGSPIPAPAGGISVTLTSADPGCVAATSPVVIPAGLVNTTATLSFGGVTTPTCAAVVTATSPNIAADSVTATVSPAPPINLTGTTVGAGLQRSWFGSLGAS
ncbi:MAG: beta strand repeat-containing protein, partial [Gemmatimonadales bacterium]